MSRTVAFVLLVALLAVCVIPVTDATPHSSSGKEERAEPSASDHHPSSSQRHASSSSSSPPQRTPSLQSRQYAGERVVFSDDFDTFDFEVWEHELTMAGGGNWSAHCTRRAVLAAAAVSTGLYAHIGCVPDCLRREFQLYTNNRSNSFVSDSVLSLKPTLTRELIGEENVLNGSICAARTVSAAVQPAAC